MNKIMLTILSILLALSLASCGSNRTQPPNSTTSLPYSSGASSPEALGSESTPALSSSMDENDPFLSSNEEKLTESADQNHAVAAKQYAVGDIIFADGSVKTAADVTAIDSSSLPVAVVVGFKEDGAALGVGVHRSAGTLQWAVDGTTGHATKFSDIVCTQDAGTVFLGDTDGSDNWEVVCTNDSQGAAAAAINYPAFDFVNTYAESHNLQGAYATGWYLPGIAELCMIYENRAAINASLEKICALDSAAAMDGMGTNWYWSSSQADSQDDYVWFVHFFNGYAGECPKNFTNVDVLAVRAF